MIAMGELRVGDVVRDDKAAYGLTYEVLFFHDPLPEHAGLGRAVVARKLFGDWREVVDSEATFCADCTLISR